MKVSDKGQTAITRYKVLGRGPDMTWLELKPETGRTHQIRVHCAAAGCPVIADRLYGTAEPGQQLHLHSRGIVLPLVEEQAADRGRGAAAAAHAGGAGGLRLHSCALTQIRSGSPISKPASRAAASSSPEFVADQRQARERLRRQQNERAPHRDARRPLRPRRCDRPTTPSLR